MKKSIFIFLLAFGIMGLDACNKDDDENNGNDSINWATELQAEIEAVNLAAQAYISNPTTENCLAYKAAAQAYLDALKPYGNNPALTGQTREQWEQALAEAQESVDNIDCS